MRNVSLLVVLALSASACGSADGATGPNKPSTSGKHAVSTSTEPGAFTPPALLDGYTRLEARTVSDLQPGDDVTQCQYVMAPVDHDMDVMDITGAQSKFGHHAVAFSYVPTQDDAVGSDIKCMMGSTEFTGGAAGGSDTGSDPALTGGTYLGGVGPVPGRVAALPEGVAFRLKKGEGIMLNLHYINTSLEPVDGDAYVDLKLADAAPDRLIAAIFLNLNAGFSLPPNAQTDSTADCVAGSDVNVIMMSNHMHEWGAHATTEVVRGDTGAVEMLRDDPTWSPDMVNNPPFSRWTADNPFVLRKGDTIRTSCSWDNTTPQTLAFPREMCISAGFALASGDNPKAPACFNGAWVNQGI